MLMQEKEAKNIEIPNIKWDVFELMMRYFGSVPFIKFWSFYNWALYLNQFSVEILDIYTLEQ